MTILDQAVPVGANIDTLFNVALSPLCAIAVVALAYLRGSLFQVWFIGYVAAFLLSTRMSKSQTKVDWSKQTVVLTGGARGVGLELLGRLGAAGARHIAVLDILDIAANKLPANATYYKCNLADSAQLAQIIDLIVRDHGTVTMLVNNAGTLCPHLVHEHSTADISRVLNVNLLAPMELTRQLLPGMLQEPHAHIVFVSSVLAFIGTPQLSTYTASKAGLTAFYESLKLELRHRVQGNVHVTVFFPSKIQSGMFNGLDMPAWLSPELPVPAVANAIFDALDKGQDGEVYMPLFASLAPLYMFSPQLARDLANWASGSIDAMRNFAGHTK